MSPASVKIVTVVGARPQFVKAAPVSRALAAVNAREVMLHTGQHHDPEMSAVFFEELGLPAPDHHLGIHGGGHGDITGRMLMALEPTLAAEAPDWVLVYGDTNSTLAAALAAAKLHIPVAHVEAGLRSYNRAMPEEINRVLTDHVSARLYCPTSAAVENLAREGVTRGVRLVGDVMFDAALSLADRARQRSAIVETLGLTGRPFVLATAHRAENTDHPQALRAVVDHLKALAREQTVVMPLHPRTRTAVDRLGLDLAPIQTIGPVGPLDMAQLLAACALVVTDSGGLQKEAYFHRKPCVTMRGETEWVETIEHGWNRLWTTPDYRPRRPIADYGDGRAAIKIARDLAGLDTAAQVQ